MESRTGSIPSDCSVRRAATSLGTADKRADTGDQPWLTGAERWGIRAARREVGSTRVRGFSGVPAWGALGRRPRPPPWAGGARPSPREGSEFSGALVRVLIKVRSTVAYSHASPNSTMASTVSRNGWTRRTAFQSFRTCLPDNSTSPVKYQMSCPMLPSGSARVTTRSTLS